MFESFVKENKKSSCGWEARSKTVWFLFLSHSVTLRATAGKVGSGAVAF